MLATITGHHPAAGGLDERIETAHQEVAEAADRLEAAKREARQARTYINENRFAALIADSLGIQHPRHNSH